MKRLTTLALLVCLVFTGCTTTATFDALGNKTGESRSFELTPEHVIALETLHGLALQAIDAIMELKGSMDAAEFDRKLADEQAKADKLATNIALLKELLASRPQRE